MGEITYSDKTTYYPKRVKLVEARLGDFSATGTSKTAAKAALLELIVEHSRHVYSRRYLHAPDGAVFVLYYVAGWGYDISRPGQRFPSSVGLGDVTKREAFERMERHFNQYVGVAA